MKYSPLFDPDRLIRFACAAVAVLCTLAAVAVAAPAASASATGGSSSYWLASSAGQVYAFGGAKTYGSETGRLHRRESVVGIEGTPNGKGYWLVTSAGRISGFGDAAHYKYKHERLVAYHASVRVRGLRGRIVGFAVANVPVTHSSPATVSVTPPTVTIPATTTTTPAITTTTAPPTSSAPTSCTTSSAANTPAVTSLSDSGQAVNWSGYVETTTSAFTSATGTFTVPSLVSGDSLQSAISEWVGIDGFDSEDLIQAGVALFPTGGGSFAIQPWWEILPAAETPITSVTVNAGDTVTVTLSELCSGGWEISLSDLTNGESFSTQQAYSGSGASAEWIVEAPATENASDNGYCYLPLAQFSPNIEFSSLATSQTSAALNLVQLVQTPAYDQSGCTPLAPQYATPSALDSTGFNLGYGATPPAAP
jgi:hypothetical protein